MTRIRSLICILFVFFIQLGAPAEKEILMPRMQINTYLSHAKPVSQFNLSIQGEGDALSLTGSVSIPPQPSVSLDLKFAPLPVIYLGTLPSADSVLTLIDISSPISWMEFSSSMKLNAIFLENEGTPFRYEGTYNTGDIPAYAAIIPELNISSQTQYNTPVYVRMALHSLGPLARGIKAPTIDCILGYDVIRNVEFIRFDFRNAEITISSETPYTPEKELLMTSAMIQDMDGSGLTVEGSIDGTPTPIIIDPAGSYHFSRGDIKTKTTKQVAIGDIVYRKVPTLLLPSHQGPPRAGRKMLENYIVTVCPQSDVVHFERYPE